MDKKKNTGSRDISTPNTFIFLDSSTVLHLDLSYPPHPTIGGDWGNSESFNHQLKFAPPPKSLPIFRACVVL